ncbi:MAG TPA: hypothetical protein VLL97_03850 [Acidobacteriota bacterium]|nr:hypothetical protein [Acidobacteriota bacterium]
MHETLLIVFLGILAIAVLMQSILFFLMHKSIQRLTRQVDGLGGELRAKVEVISGNVAAAADAIKDIVEAVKPVAEKLSETSGIVHNRAVELDAFLEEAMAVARREMLRVQDTIQTATRRTQETVTILRDNILAPVTEITSITRAIKVIFEALFRRRRRPAKVSSQDDEMFF